MAPNKFDNIIKDKLQHRSLPPSTDAWEKLSGRLVADEKRKSNKIFLMIGIAASLVGILLVTSIYFNNQPMENQSPVIVDTEEKVIPQQEIQKESNQLSDMESLYEEVNVEVKDTKQQIAIPMNAKTTTKSTVISNNFQAPKIEDKVIAQNEQPILDETVNPVKQIEQSILTFEEEKIKDVVAQINKMRTNDEVVTDAEIKALLKKAHKDIISSKIYNENTRTVDANALLQDVEEDLQQSFRDKVFEALKSGYESVKTAVADRKPN